MSRSLERETERDNQENVYSEVFQLENHFAILDKAQLRETGP
jgi:hypothetical protein